jgi:lipoprotein-anchoring transpeptidase ErfK/SrfK
MHQGFVAGYPVSHGCVRMPEDMARIFYENTPMGTTVIVK